MASEYSPELRIQLMQTGEKSGLWGDITNVNWELIESAVSGAATVTATAPDTILTASNGIADESRCAIIVLTGSPAGAFNVFAPPETKTYIVKNNTSATASIFCSTVLGNNVAAGAAYTLLAGRSAYIRTNGVTFFDAIDYLDTPLSADSGGTGHASYAVGDLLYANTTATLAKLPDVATGNALISKGLNTAPAWGKVGLTTHVTGVLDETNGGTGQATIPALSVLVANTLNTLSPLTVSAGQSVKLNGGGTAWEAYTPAGGGGGDVTFTGTAPTASVNQVAVYGATGTSITTGRTYQFRATSAGQAQIQLFEDTDNGTNAVIIQPPAALAANYTLTLPADDGAASQFLQTDGSGVLSWATVGGAGTVTSVASGNGMNFTTITGTGTVTMGTPTTLTSATTNLTTATSHTHAVTGIPTTYAWTAGTTSGPTGSLTGSGASSVSFSAIPSASATASGVVTTGSQTFAGTKTFNSILAPAYNFTANDSIFGVTNAVVISTGGAARVDVISSSFAPRNDNAMTLGASGYRWSVVWAATGTINTSDASAKQDIADLDDAEKRVAIRIKALIKKFRFKDAVAEKGDAARIHVGVIAQDVRDAFTVEGLDPTRYALFCSDTWWEREEDVEYPPTKEMRREKVIHRTPVDGAAEITQLGVRYEQLLAFVIAAM